MSQRGVFLYFIYAIYKLSSTLFHDRIFIENNRVTGWLDLHFILHRMGGGADGQ